MNTRLRNQAVEAVTDPAFIASRGMCQAFARQVVQAVYGDEYDDYHGPSAKVSAHRWDRGGFRIRSAVEPGDLLYKTGGSWGHVGVYVGTVPGHGNALVAENSSTSIGRVSGAKGYRSLGQYGEWQITVRIDDTADDPFEDVKHFELVLHGRVIARMPLHDGHAHVEVVEFCERLGIGNEVGWLEADKHVTIGGRELECDLWLPDGHAWAPIRPLAAHVGLAIEEPDDDRRVVLYRP